MEFSNWNEIVDSGVALDFDAYIDVPSLVDVQEGARNIYTDSSQQKVNVNTDIGDDVHTRNNNLRQSPNETINDSLDGSQLSEKDSVNLHTGSFLRFPVNPSPSTACNVFNSYSINPKKTIIKRPKTGRALLCSPSPAFRFARPHTPSQSSRSPSPVSSICNSDATIAPVTPTYLSNSTINVTSPEILKALQYLQRNVRREYEEKLIELEYSLRTEYNEKNEVELHRVREECRVEFEALLQERMKELERDYETRLDEMRIEFEETLKERMEEVQAICNEMVEEKDKQVTSLKRKLQRGTIRNMQMMMEDRKVSTRLKSREEKQKEEKWETEVIRVERPGKNRSPKEIAICEDHPRPTSDVSSIHEIDETSTDVPSVLERGGDSDDANTKYLSEGEIDETSSPIASIPPDQDMEFNEVEKKFIFGLQLEYALERARLLDALQEIRTCWEKITGLEKCLQEREVVNDHSESDDLW